MNEDNFCLRGNYDTKDNIEEVWVRRTVWSSEGWGDKMKAVILIDIPDNQLEDIKYPFENMYANVTLDYGDKFLYLNGEVKEMETFINQNFDNPYNYENSDVYLDIN